MKNIAIILLVFTILSSPFHGKACSTFMIKNKSQHIIGHNLDISGKMPGMVFINKRGIQKRGHTWADLTSIDGGDKSGISWVSSYGSITFNAFGRDLPDGGMNEKGLFIWEMSGNTTFDKEEKRPRLFMSQWIQYQLDNHETVEEVLDNLPALGLDGWNWHFFITDQKGETAAVEFIDGVPIVISGNNMPIPIMGNGRYSDDQSFLNEFKGFGGNINIDLDDPNLPGFVKAAKMISECPENIESEKYGFSILEQLSGKVSKWALVFDINEKRIYFRTTQYPDVKSFSMETFDFSAQSPVMTLNIQDSTITGDASNKFVEFRIEDNFLLAQETVKKLYQADEFEISEDTLVKRLATAYETKGIRITEHIEGQWAGYAEYPTTGEPATVDWLINIDMSDGKISGKITDSAGLLSETEMRNIVFENGILQFSVYSYGYVFKIYAKVTDEGIEGIFGISDEYRKGNFHVDLASND